MDELAKEIRSYYGIASKKNSLKHYGMPRRSGRYPWGSGDDPYQHGEDFLSRIDELKKSGWKETPESIKSAFDMNTSEYRREKALAKSERRMYQVNTAKALTKDGLSPTEIGRKMGVRESTVRSWLNPVSEEKMKKARATADFLKSQVDEKGMIDVGVGVELELNISKEKLKQAIDILEGEGYHLYGGRVPQATNPGKLTTISVLAGPEYKHKDIFNFENIHTVHEYTSRDDGKTFTKLKYPSSLDSKRLAIRYAENGGIDRDGVMEIRRGVKDLDLKGDHYAQVRILVDNAKYLKGMAVYSDDLPDGVDIVFNTNKKSTTPKMDVLKDIKNDPDNPFGALIKANGQYEYEDSDGKMKLGLINKKSSEGDWTEWKDAIPAQFLSKQPLSLAKKQLNLAIVDKKSELDDIMHLTNPTVKKQLLWAFANDCDATAVDLKAAALPKQKYHVILPINTLKDNEVYAPGYEQGTKLALIRYPHAGTFEIPILTVNNKNALGQKWIGKNAIDAVGINKKNADRLSGADFDGDTVMTIPTHDIHGRVKIASTPLLEGLKGFEPKDAYGADKITVDDNGIEHYFQNGIEYKRMSKAQTQREMGVISNLITDMTLRGASDEEKAAAVRHSMVVIDAHKHKLNYRQSYIDNNIAALKKSYQTGGASTLISRSKSRKTVDKRQGAPKVNIKGKSWYDPTRPEGVLVYSKAKDDTYIKRKVNKKTGEVIFETVKRTENSTKMAETDDAYSLISEADTPMERAYADYANTMKALANQARIEMINTGKIAYSPEAKKKYESEVKSLGDKLKKSGLNAPRERQAQYKASTIVKNKKDNFVKEYRKSNPDSDLSYGEIVKKMDKKDLKKISQQALVNSRYDVGAARTPVEITDREWEAIQSGAVSENVLVRILNNTDLDKVKQRAMPRATTELSDAKKSKIRAMANSNYSLSEIAKAVGCSTSTVSNELKGA